MTRAEIDSRLRELGIYSDLYHRKELKALAQLLESGEQLNCALTGVHEANRKMVAVTDRRVIIIFAGALGAGDVTVIRREGINDYSFDKKMLFSSMSVTSNDGAVYSFTNTQGSRKELFIWAMEKLMSA